MFFGIVLSAITFYNMVKICIKEYVPIVFVVTNVISFMIKRQINWIKRIRNEPLFGHLFASVSIKHRPTLFSDDICVKYDTVASKYVTYPSLIITSNNVMLLLYGYDDMVKKMPLWFDSSLICAVPYRLLTITFKHNHLPYELSIELNESVYLQGNEVLSYEHVMYYLTHTYEPTLFFINKEYTLSIMDDNINIVQLTANQFIRFEATEYIICGVPL